MTTNINNTNTNFPPVPPNSEEKRNFSSFQSLTTLNNVNSNISFVPGKFYYIHEKATRDMYVTAWQAINITENWSFVSHPIDSFMFSSNPELHTIYEKIEELGYYDHSGCSFGFIMREMQFIAKNGENEFKKLYEKNRNEKISNKKLYFI